VNPIFEREDFRAFERLFMQLPLATPLRFTAPLPEEITIRGWQEMDFQPAASVITAAYVGHIDSEINDQYRTVNGSLRFLNNIIRFPGCGVFDASSSFVATNRYTGAIIGLLLCSRVRDDVGHVTQVCLLPEHRRRGIGEALIAACTRDLRARNFSQLTLTVTEANHRAVELYQHLGFTTSRVFDAFVWEG
jgi:ribosomal protein S18 acetylase RimI-like enzyme